MNLPCLLVFMQLIEASAELIFRRLSENQSLQLSCPLHLHREAGDLQGLQLYHRGARGQTTLLALSRGDGGGGGVRMDPERGRRLQLHGTLDSRQVRVDLSHLEAGDAGLYVWELSLDRADSGPDLVLEDRLLFLFVAGRSCPGSSSSHLPLILVISAAAVIIGLSLCCQATHRCQRTRDHHKAPPAVPIYEEMTRKQQSAAAATTAAGPCAQNNQEAPSHLEEEDFPVYANPTIRQPQDNYYACPRQLALRA